MTKKQLFALILTNNYHILKNDVNWYELLSLSISEKLEGYFYYALLGHKFPDNLPKQVKKILYLCYQYNKEKNILYFEELKKIKEIFSANGISLFPYKGMYLLDEIYTDYGMRYMEDIDIISPGVEYETLESILLDYGYRLTLINDIDKSLYCPDTPVSSCLFIKENHNGGRVQQIKLDILLDPLVPDQEKIFDTGKNIYLLPQYIFLLSCRSLFDDAHEKANFPSPESCTLIKLLDIFLLMKKYPKQSEYIIQYSSFTNTDFIVFTRECIQYFSERSKLWIQEN